MKGVGDAMEAFRQGGTQSDLHLDPSVAVVWRQDKEWENKKD